MNANTASVINTGLHVLGAFLLQKKERNIDDFEAKVAARADAIAAADDRETIPGDVVVAAKEILAEDDQALKTDVRPAVDQMLKDTGVSENTEGQV